MKLYYIPLLIIVSVFLYYDAEYEYCVTESWYQNCTKCCYNAYNDLTRTSYCIDNVCSKKPVKLLPFNFYKSLECIKEKSWMACVACCNKINNLFASSINCISTLCY
jgi:hypothetical protein